MEPPHSTGGNENSTIPAGKTCLFLKKLSAKHTLSIWPNNFTPVNLRETKSYPLKPSSYVSARGSFVHNRWNMEAKNWTQLSKPPELMEATPRANGYTSVGSHKWPCSGCTVQKPETDEQHGRASASAEEEDAGHYTARGFTCNVQDRHLNMSDLRGPAAEWGGGGILASDRLSGVVCNDEVDHIWEWATVTAWLYKLTSLF